MTVARVVAFDRTVGQGEKLIDVDMIRSCASTPTGGDPELPFTGLSSAEMLTATVGLIGGGAFLLRAVAAYRRRKTNDRIRKLGTARTIGPWRLTP